jgi:hypothetical protein
MSTGTLYCLDSSRNTADSLSVSDTLCKIICELGGGIFVKVCRNEGLVLWRSPASGLILYCPIDSLSAERVRKTTLDSDSLTAVTQVEP